MIREARILIGGIFLGIAIGLEFAKSEAHKRLNAYRLELVRIEKDEP